MGKGKRMTNTVALFRARDDAERTAARLAALGCEAAIAPAFEPAALTPPPPPAGAFAAVLATSARAIAFAPLRVLGALPLLVVGETTARAAKAKGIAVSAPPARDAEELARAIVATFAPSERLLYLVGRDRKPDLERALAGSGFAVVALEVYEMRARAAWDAEEAASVRRAVAALHYSRRSAELAVTLALGAGLGARWLAMRHVAISADAAAPLAASGVEPAVAGEPNENAMLAALWAAR